MAAIYTTTFARANRLGTAFEQVTGQPTSIMRDNGSWRVQSNDLGNDAAHIISSMINRRESMAYITRENVLAEMQWMSANG